jgi:hypothetical protein
MIDCAARKSSKAWTHLATGAEDEKIPFQFCHRHRGFVIGAREQFFQF